MNTRSRWIPTALAVALLAACGGGGSDSPAPVTTASVAMTGTAAKGPMANADVAALAVNADGSIGTTPLATALTDPTGAYTLNFTATKDQPYVIKVSAKADGSTTHVDEVSGQTQNLPAGFVMRALFVPTSTGNVTTSASITPFSELAVAAATRATGGVTAANASQAVSTLRQLFGFDPTGAAVKSTATATSADDQKLAVLLTTVSKLAGTGALGCTSGTPGEVTQCVVGKLSDAASSTTLKLNAGGTDVSAALDNAVTAVMADSNLRGQVAPSTMSAIQDNFKCKDPCTAAPPATASAIDSARTLFTQIKSDWQTLFSRGGASSIATGAANAEGWKFRQAMSGVQVPASMLVKDLGTLLMAVDLYNDYKGGRTLSNSRGRAPDNFNTDTPATVANMNTVGCTLYQDSGTVTPATSPSNANFIGCRASHKINVTGVAATGVTVDWRHGFTITPPSTTPGEFTYTTRARRRTTDCTVNPCTVDNAALQTNFYSGTVTTTTNGEGSVVSFSAVGDLPAMFAEDGITLVNDHNALNMSGTRTISGNHNETSSLTGSLESFAVAVAPATLGPSLGKLTVKSGGTSEIPVACDANFNEVKPGSPSAVVPLCSGAIDSVSLDLLWTTATAEFEGVLSAGPTTWDSTGTDRIPNAAKLSGALRNIEGSTVTEFLQGEFNATATGFAGFNAQQPDSTTNYYTTAVTFAGTVTAPSRPVLKLTASGSKKSYETDVAAVTMQYSVLVGGAPRTVIAIDVSPGAGGHPDFKLSEATSGLSMTWVHDAPSANLVKGTDTVGTLTQSDKMLTFSNGTVISLDIGL